MSQENVDVIRSFFEAWSAGDFERAYEVFYPDAEVVTDFIHIADRVVARYEMHGEGHGPPTTLEVTIIHGVRHGKIHSVEFFWDHHAALDALGLAE